MKYDLAVIILNYNTEQLLKQCLNSIFANPLPQNSAVCVVDNNSSDGSVTMIRKNFPRVKILESSENGGFSKGNNLGIKAFDANWYLLLNSDTIIKDGALVKLCLAMKESSFDIGSCKLLNIDGTLQPNVGELPFGIAFLSWITGIDDIFGGALPSFHIMSDNFYQGQKSVGWVSGTALMIKQTVIESIGGLDERIFMYGEDVEYCMRARRNGFKVGWTDQASIVHLGGGSSKDPKFRQWLGEFRGVLYLYCKYYNQIVAMGIKILLWVFIFLRMIVFALVGRLAAAKTYGKILVSL